MDRGRSRRLRAQSVFLGSLALPALVLLGGCGDKTLPAQDVVRPVKAMRVADASQLTDRSFPGRAKATQEVNLSFRVPGPLITRPMDVGDAVNAGDIVARIDPRDFEVNLQSVQGHLAEARALLKRAEADYQRLSRILKKDPGATSDKAVDLALADRDRAAANVDSLVASVASAEDQLSYTYLKAPFDGTVVATYVENFEDVLAKQAIVRILDTSRIEMVINIPENLISLAPDVTDITVTFDAFPDQPVPATTKEVGSEASETTRTYPVTLIMDQPQGFKILPGMAGRATGTPPDSYRVDSVVVPVSAVFSPKDDKMSYVWVIDERTKTVSRRAVTATELTDRGIQVTSGLKAGEWIATAGVHYLEEGQKVTRLGQ